MADHPWYESTTNVDISQDDLLRQGDFLSSCPVLVPDDDTAFIAYMDETASAIPLRRERYDIIILTQTCDLVNRKAGFVACCPRYSWGNYAELALPGKSNRERLRFWNDLRTGRLVGLHLLSNWAARFDFQVVEFRNLISLPIGYVRSLAQRESDRIRLKPPYREHLSQAFAQTFMRVALDADIKESQFQAPSNK